MTRLYLTQTLRAGQMIKLNKDQRHYLEKVLRFSQGQHFFGFNEKDGEWKVVFEKPEYRCENQTRELVKTETCWVAFSLIKHDPMNFLIEKATELGVTDLQPIMCERTNSHRLNIKRLTKNAIEASQQCERFDVPRVHESLTLKNFLNTLPNKVHWYTALERSNAEAVSLEFPAGFIIGPEGGWSAQEKLMLEKCTKPISLGANVLRAETAAVVCLSAKIFQR